MPATQVGQELYDGLGLGPARVGQALGGLAGIVEPGTDRLAQLDEAEHRKLDHALTIGFLDIELAMKCLSQRRLRKTRTVEQFVADLTEAIEELEVARNLVQQRA